MQIRVFLPAFAAAALAAASALAASTPYAEAKLAAPISTPKTVVVGGLSWSCAADACVATPKGSVATWPAVYACKKVSGAFGPLASYASRGLALSSGDLAACNKAAGGSTQTAAQ